MRGHQPLQHQQPVGTCPEDVMKTTEILKNRNEDTLTRVNDMCLCMSAWFWVSGKMMQMYPALLYHRANSDTFDRYTSSENGTSYASSVNVNDLLQSIEKAVNTGTVYVMFLKTHLSRMLVPVVFMTRGTQAVSEETFILCFTKSDTAAHISQYLSDRSNRRYKSCHIEKIPTASEWNDDDQWLRFVWQSAVLYRVFYGMPGNRTRGDIGGVSETTEYFVRLITLGGRGISETMASLNEVSGKLSDKDHKYGTIGPRSVQHLMRQGFLSDQSYLYNRNTQENFTEWVTESGESLNSEGENWAIGHQVYSMFLINPFYRS